MSDGGSSGPWPAPETDHVTAPECMECGRRLAGVICVIDPEPVIVCPQCAPPEPVPGVYVRQPLDAGERRWFPDSGGSYLGRMGP